MSKDVNIEVPCLDLEWQVKAPQPERPMLKLHLVPVPEAALAEVQEVLKRYQPELDKINQAISHMQDAHKLP